MWLCLVFLKVGEILVFELENGVTDFIRFCILVWLVRITASSTSVIFQFADTLYVVMIGLLFVHVLVYMCLRCV